MLGSQFGVTMASRSLLIKIDSLVFASLTTIVRVCARIRISSASLTTTFQIVAVAFPVSSSASSVVEANDYLFRV